MATFTRPVVVDELNLFFIFPFHSLPCLYNANYGPTRRCYGRFFGAQKYYTVQCTCDANKIDYSLGFCKLLGNYLHHSFQFLVHQFCCQLDDYVVVSMEYNINQETYSEQIMVDTFERKKLTLC